MAINTVMSPLTPTEWKEPVQSEGGSAAAFQTPPDKVFTGYRIILPLFQGPLDLLIYLLQREEIDIYQIPAALITQQYLEYLAQEPLHPQEAAEFIVMAATLVELKSRSLLPKPERPPEETEEEEGPDPRAELLARMLEYKRYQQVAAFLGERAEEFKFVFSRADLDGERETQNGHPGYVLEGALSTFDLWAAVQQLLARAQATTPEELARPRITIAMKIAEITRLLQANRDGVQFLTLFSEAITRLEIIITFLALLELLRRRMIRAEQPQPFGEIWVYPHGVA